MTTDGGSSDGKAFTKLAAPTITSLDKTSAFAGDSVTITGTYLRNPSASPSAAAITVKVGAVAATVVTVNSATSVTFTVPATAVVGANTVTVATLGGTTATTPLKVLIKPAITTVTASAKAGDVVTVTGTNMGGGTFTIGGVAATPVATFTPTAVKAVLVVPAGTAISTTVGDAPVVVTTDGGSSDGKAFTKLAAPTITSLGSDPVVVGNDLVITGTSLINPSASPSTTAITVKVGSIAATVKSANLTSVTITVPLTAVVGANTVTLTTLGGVANKSVTVKPLAPSITSLTVTTQNRGGAVTVTGTNLLNATVTIGGATAVITGSAISIVVTVPHTSSLGATTLGVTTAGGSASTSITVKSELPVVASVVATAVGNVKATRPGALVSITGGYLTGSTVKFGALTISSGDVTINSDGSLLTFHIPALAVTAANVITLTNTGGPWSSSNPAEKVTVTAS